MRKHRDKKTGYFVFLSWQRWGGINNKPTGKPLFFMQFIKQLLLFLIVLFTAGNLSAQEIDTASDLSADDAVNTDARTAVVFPEKDFSAIDTYVLGLKRHYKKIPDLAKDLTLHCSNDEEKVRAIFIWITNNISYDCPQFHSKKDMNIKFTYKTQEELDEKRNAYYYNYGTRVLRSRKGICEGYAVLFQLLCRENGIPCEIAIGRVSNNTHKIEKVRGKKNFATNHAWDKVKIGNEWFYADPTWASGYCDKDVKKFYRSYKPYYYLTPLDKLYVTHAENEKQSEKRNNVIAKIR
jgi:transglutaminase-like putative cysteine protease